LKMSQMKAGATNCLSKTVNCRNQMTNMITKPIMPQNNK
jgi:hypothetical protein